MEQHLQRFTSRSVSGSEILQSSEKSITASARQNPQFSPGPITLRSSPLRKTTPDANEERWSALNSSRAGKPASPEMDDSTELAMKRASKPAGSAKVPKIVLLIESSRASGRALLRGVASYTHH